MIGRSGGGRKRKTTLVGGDLQKRWRVDFFVGKGSLVSGVRILKEKSGSFALFMIPERRDNDVRVMRY